MPDPKAPISAKVAALRTEAGLAAILDGIGEGFYALDGDFRIILFNDEAARHFRCKPCDMLGQILWERFPGARETGLGQQYLQVMASREPIRSEDWQQISKRERTEFAKKFGLEIPELPTVKAGAPVLNGNGHLPH